MKKNRRSGILLHLTSLPYFDFAYDFIKFLFQSGQTLWQILPMNPVMSEGSPYKCYSAFACDARFISKKYLLDQNLVADISKDDSLLIEEAYKNLQKSQLILEYEAFLEKNNYWLCDYSLFMALKKHFNNLPWNEWDEDIARRHKKAVEHYTKLLSHDIELNNYTQFIIYCGFLKIKEYANKNSIDIIGDLPLYVAYDSADVWANPSYFKLDKNRKPKTVAGVPPDYFNEDGQLWGNPVYNWKNIQKSDYIWWRERLTYLKSFVDIVRIDHFRGLESYYEVDSKETDAKKGKWVKAPGEEILNVFTELLGTDSIIAEDLGFITEDVIGLKEKFALPGMKVLQFEQFANEENSVVYTGTHDNDTILGWLDKIKLQNPDYFNKLCSTFSISSQVSECSVWGIIEHANRQKSRYAVIPMQDLLCLGSNCRMNIPGSIKNNWNYKCSVSDFSLELSEKLYEISKKYNRNITDGININGSDAMKKDIEKFKKGEHYESYKFLGAHICHNEGEWGVRFSVWAPAAVKVFVVGDFNNWTETGYEMENVDGSGVWTLFVACISEYSMYKYKLYCNDGEVRFKSDPYAFFCEDRPGTASKVLSLDKYRWNEHEYIWQQKKKCSYNNPMNIYEVHLGSWKRGEDGKYKTYREIADELSEYISLMGYTHVELMPIMEHPYDGSWGYQLTGYFAPTSRFGIPSDFMYFVNKFHEMGIGVILDWVPGHFCKDEHGLYRFDGTPLFEYSDTQKSESEGWGTANFNLEKYEVISFLISNAVFWYDVFHIDGIRIDAVASMLYLDYGKHDGNWNPNMYGGREKLEGVEFFKKLNTVIFEKFPQVLMMAEESTSWPMVSSPCDIGGLGFNYKWNMGWMNDMLKYMEMDSIHRKWHHNLLTFSMMYAYSENFVLPLSHDEVVHGKRSLLDKMFGNYEEKFSSLRLFLGFMMTHPGKKLMFMGGEFGQFCEWKYDSGLDWCLLDFDMHKKLHKYVRVMNHLYKESPELWEEDYKQSGFEWIDANNNEQSIAVFIRRSKDKSIIAVCNFTPVSYDKYRIGVSEKDEYIEILNSDSEEFGGNNIINKGLIKAEDITWHNRTYSIEISVSPLSIMLFRSSC